MLVLRCVPLITIHPYILNEFFSNCKATVTVVTLIRSLWVAQGASAVVLKNQLCYPNLKSSPLTLNFSYWMRPHPMSLQGSDVNSV